MEFEHRKIKYVLAIRATYAADLVASFDNKLHFAKAGFDITFGVDGRHSNLTLREATTNLETRQRRQHVGGRSEVDQVFASQNQLGWLQAHINSSLN